MKCSWIIVGLLLALNSACAHKPAAPVIAPNPVVDVNVSTPFVSTQGLQFVRKNKPYFFVGTNLWYGANLAATHDGRARLIRELDLMKKLGITNIRVLGASEGPGQHNSVRPQFKPSREQVNERVLRGLDFVMAEMGKRDMTAVIYLNNFWIWSGGMSQYVSWLTEKPVPNPFDAGHTWTEFMEFSAQFYGNTEAQALYRQFIKTLVNRTNTVTGLAYKDDPVILSWQLANEPRPGSSRNTRENMPVFLGWLEGTADYIKSLDSHHLVSSGMEGIHGCDQDLDCYVKSSSIPSIDYLNMHIWILNWGWLDPKNMQNTYTASLQKALSYLQRHAEIATQLGKPITLEEFGAPRDGENYSHRSSTVYRDKYFLAMFAEIYNNAASGGPIAGSNFWAWGGEGRAATPSEAVWHDGDDFVGDPPQEPQGLNSIFSSDETTLGIISRHGKQMKQLSNFPLAGATEDSSKTLPASTEIAR